jgi:hypothetical protein
MAPYYKKPTEKPTKTPNKKPARKSTKKPTKKPTTDMPVAKPAVAAGSDGPKTGIPQERKKADPPPEKGSMPKRPVITAKITTKFTAVAIFERIKGQLWEIQISSTTV